MPEHGGVAHLRTDRALLSAIAVANDDWVWVETEPQKQESRLDEVGRAMREMCML
jgi:hypothetical protein